jgi:hypothetical protein
MTADKKPDFKSVFICALPAHLFRNATARAYEPPPVLFFHPASQCGALRGLWLMMMPVMFTLCGLRAAMFTEPAITQIEKVGRLVHRPELHKRQRRESGDSISRTATDIRLPSRQI